MAALFFVLTVAVLLLGTCTLEARLLSPWQLSKLAARLIGMQWLAITKELNLSLETQ